MPIDLIIRNAQVVTPKDVTQCDLFIHEGVFVDNAAEARTTIDATGLHAFPGVIDSHVHFNEPGRTDWEGIATGSAALAAGGGTCFFDMPLNSSPPVLDGKAFDAKRAAAEASSVTDFGIWGGLTPLNLDKMEELAERGVVGFKAFMCDSGIDEFPAADDDTLYRGLEIAAKLKLIVGVHAENNTLARSFAEEAKRNGHTMADFLRSRPLVVELEAIRRARTLAEATGCKLHIVHISAWDCLLEADHWTATYLGMQDDRQFDVSMETCPHYLLLNDTDAIRIGPAAKCAPPLRNEANRIRLQSCVNNFTFVASDHSPAPLSMKQSDDAFANWGGIAGVQSTLSAMLSLEDVIISPSTVATLTAGNVAMRFQLWEKGEIAKSRDADVCLVDLNATFTLEREQLLDRHKLSPYVGREFRGVVKRTIVRGTTVFDDGKIVSRPIGRLVSPERYVGMYAP